MSDLPRTHDRFFRRVFSRQDAARELLRAQLPLEVLARLDLDAPVEPSERSYVDEHLRGHVADLAFRVRMRGVNDRRAVVYVLVEHKSAPDRWVGLQLLRYMTRIWDEHRREGASLPLPPIIPLVFHHGRRDWRVPTDFAALVDAPPEMEPHVPQFRYLLTDLGRMADDEVRGPPEVRLPLLVLLHIFDDDLEARFLGVLAPAADVADTGTRMELVLTCVYYILNARRDVSMDELARAVQQVLPPREGETVMRSAAERLRDEGRQEGRQEGRREGRQEGLRDAILEVIESRFGWVPGAVRERIAQIDDLEVLRSLHRTALHCESPDRLLDVAGG